MNSKFEWFGISVARKHVYFYSLLIVGSIFANTMKEEFVGGSSETDAALAEFNQMTEKVAALDAAPLY
jgi:hypothetical protein